MSEENVLAKTHGILVIQNEDGDVEFFATFPKHTFPMMTISFDTWEELLHDAMKRRAFE